MKKAVLVFLSLMIVMAILMAGCSGAEEPATTTEPAATTEPTPATTAPAPEPAATTEPTPATPAPAAPEEDKAYELRFSSYLTEGVTEQWERNVEEASNGRLEVVIFANSSLVAAADTPMSLREGICDIALHPIEMAPEMYPLNNVLTMPFLPLGDMNIQYKLWHTLQDEFPELAAEWGDFVVLCDDTTGGNALHTIGKQVIAPEDLDGMRIQAAGTTAEITEDLGGTPLYLGVPDWFTSLDRGLLDGMFLPWDAVYEINVYPLLPYHTTFPGAEGMLMRNMLMNMDSWNSLPADLQQVLLDQGPIQRQYTWDTLAEKNVLAVEAVNATGGTIVDLTPEQVDAWFQVAKPHHEAYLADVDAMGLPATEVYNRAIELAAEYAKVD